MKKKENIFEIENRRRIYNYILKNPGLHFRQITRNLNIPKSTLDYHLFFLTKKGFISIVEENRYKRYYINQNLSTQDKNLINILREDVPRNIVLYLLLYNYSSLEEILKYAKFWTKHPSKIGLVLNKHQSTINFHLKKLIDMKIISFFEVNNTKKYYLTNPEDICNLCIIYEKSLLGKAKGRLLNWVDLYYFFTIDKVIKRGYNIFPHPYHC